MPQINTFATALPEAPPSTSSEAMRRQLIAAQLLQKTAADTSQPVYSMNGGYAKLAAGALGGILEGYEEGKERNAQKESTKLLAAALGYPTAAATPAASASPVAGQADAGGDPAGMDPASIGRALSAEGVSSGPSPQALASVLSAPEGQAAGQATAPPELGSMFAAKEKEYGLPSGYLGQTAQIESSMNPAAQNPKSSAGGLFQFLDKTAKQYGLSDKFDPAASTDAAARFGRDNMDGLKQTLGRDPTSAELYLAHQQGLGGASRILANPNAQVASLVGNDAAAFNGGAGANGQQFADKWAQKFNGAQPAPQAAASVDGAILPPNAQPAGPAAPGTSPPQQIAQAQPSARQMDPALVARALADPRIPPQMKQYLLERSQPDLERFQVGDNMYTWNKKTGRAELLMEAPSKPMAVKADERLYQPGKGVVLPAEAKPQVVAEGGSLIGANGQPIYQSPAKPQVVPENSRLIGPGGNVITPADKQNFRSLTDPAERASYGIPAGDKRVFQVGPDNKIHEAGGNLVSIDQKAESALESGRGAGLSKRLNAIADDGADAQVDIQTVGRLRQLMGNVDPGSKTALLEKIRGSTGIALDPNADNVQAASAIVKYMMPRMRIAGAGTTSDRDLAAFEAALPSLLGTPQGNAIIMDTLQGTAEFKKRRADIAGEWQGGDIGHKEAQRRMNELPNPFEKFNAASANQAQPAAAAASNGIRKFNPATGRIE